MLLSVVQDLKLTPQSALVRYKLPRRSAPGKPLSLCGMTWVRSVLATVTFRNLIQVQDSQ